MRVFSPSTVRGLFAVTGVTGFPEVDGGAVPRLGSPSSRQVSKILLFSYLAERA